MNKNKKMKFRKFGFSASNAEEFITNIKEISVNNQKEVVLFKLSVLGLKEYGGVKETQEESEDDEYDMLSAKANYKSNRLITKPNSRLQKKYLKRKILSDYFIRKNKRAFELKQQ